MRTPTRAAKTREITRRSARGVWAFATRRSRAPTRRGATRGSGWQRTAEATAAETLHIKPIRYQFSRLILPLPALAEPWRCLRAQPLDEIHDGHEEGCVEGGGGIGLKSECVRQALDALDEHLLGAHLGVAAAGEQAIITKAGALSPTIQERFLLQDPELQGLATVIARADVRIQFGSWDEAQQLFTPLTDAEFTIDSSGVEPTADDIGARDGDGESVCV